MRSWRKLRKTHCPICNRKLSRSLGKLECTICNLVLVGDSCKFLDLPQIILGRHDNRKR
jgi:uncharacterized Zn finger protein (UPF0148 family)